MDFISKKIYKNIKLIIDGIYKYEINKWNQSKTIDKSAIPAT